ncbi:hypothetical protein BGX21_000441 [Mortierella sp. AD011]|nr:hypothetical protein BGX20_008800 [Mortierella sp. AD010]KAF9387906.1 hypothetical protein BGX21_000441 [Mortierella sp. AD011]
MDGIDRCFSGGLKARKAAGVQIFGFIIELNHATLHVPCDQQDSNRMTSCLRLLMTLQTFLYSVDHDPVPRTPQELSMTASKWSKTTKGDHQR